MAGLSKLIKVIDNLELEISLTIKLYHTGSGITSKALFSVLR
jgi:hypothetical protein